MLEDQNKLQKRPRRTGRRNPNHPPLEPLSTVSRATEKSVHRLQEEEREQFEKLLAGTGDSAQAEPVSQINSWLFLGGLADAIDSDWLAKKNIKCILNVAKECESGPEFALPTMTKPLCMGILMLCSIIAQSIVRQSLSVSLSLSAILALTAFIIKKILEAQGSYLHLDLIDHCDECIIFDPNNNEAESKYSHQFEQAIHFIKQAKERDEKILVHCKRGISRGATTVIAYLMIEKGLPFREAYELVRCQRPFINPNLGFVLQLETLQKKLTPREKAQANLLTKPPSLSADSSQCCHLPPVISPEPKNEDSDLGLPRGCLAG